VYPPDTLSIRSVQVPEINGFSGVVRPDGKINLPLLKEVYVAGKTPKEIEEALTEASKEYYEVADATVTVTGYNSQKFYVWGQVSNPGPVQWTGRDTLLDVLSSHQPTSLAWPERIVVVRGSEPQVGGNLPEGPYDRYTKKGIHEPPEDKPYTNMIINLYAMIETGDLSHNVLLMPNDVIYVQPNPFAAVALKLETFLYPLGTITRAAGAPRTLAGAAAAGSTVP
jgi:polysaccharide export outer membrane protein